MAKCRACGSEASVLVNGECKVCYVLTTIPTPPACFLEESPPVKVSPNLETNGLIGGFIGGFLGAMGRGIATDVAVLKAAREGERTKIAAFLRELRKREQEEGGEHIGLWRAADMIESGEYEQIMAMWREKAPK